MRENTAELLQLQGYNVSTATNGLQGYKLSTQTPQPDIILCDVLMPETGGHDFLLMVKANPATRNIPLIFFSAGSAPPEVRKALTEGADLYLPKPFSAEELSIALARF